MTAPFSATHTQSTRWTLFVINTFVTKRKFLSFLPPSPFLRSATPVMSVLKRKKLNFSKSSFEAPNAVFGGKRSAQLDESSKDCVLYVELAPKVITSSCLSFYAKEEKNMMQVSRDLSVQNRYWIYKSYELLCVFDLYYLIYFHLYFCDNSLVIPISVFVLFNICVVLFRDRIVFFEKTVQRNIRKKSTLYLSFLLVLAGFIFSWLRDCISCAMYIDISEPKNSIVMW